MKPGSASTLDAAERRKILEKAAEKQRQKERERTRPMNPDRDFTWENTTFENGSYD